MFSQKQRNDLEKRFNDNLCMVKTAIFSGANSFDIMHQISQAENLKMSSPSITPADHVAMLMTTLEVYAELIKERSGDKDNCADKTKN